MKQEINKRILAAYDLLQEETTTWEKFESIRTLIEGHNNKIDKVLSSISKLRSEISKIAQGDVIQLSAERLPEKTEEDKKRKKVLLLFVKHWKNLRSEVGRVKAEFEKESKTDTGKTSNILASAKGPLGIVTIAAVIIVTSVAIMNSPKDQATKNSTETNPTSQEQLKIKAIDFKGKKIPLNELTTGIGPECLTNGESSKHYHALNHEDVKAVDGSRVQDPGGCGFGKVDETIVEEI